MPAGTVPIAVLLPARRARIVRSGRTDPRPDHRGAGRSRAGETGVVLIASLFRAPRGGHLPQHGRHPRRGWPVARPVPQDAHPRRSALLREVLLHAGRSGLPGVRHAFGRIGTLVCWDQWYPEGARADRAARAPRSCSIPRRSAGIPARKPSSAQRQHDAWRTIQRAHAIANGVYVAAVNRVGHEGHPRRRRPDSNSGAVRSSPIRSGVVIAEGVARQRGDPDRRSAISQHLEDVRRNWPFLRDRRIDAYAGITQRFLHEPT